MDPITIKYYKGPTTKRTCIIHSDMIKLHYREVMSLKLKFVSHAQSTFCHKCLEICYKPYLKAFTWFLKHTMQSFKHINTDWCEFTYLATSAVQCIYQWCTKTQTVIRSLVTRSIHWDSESTHGLQVSKKRSLEYICPNQTDKKLPCEIYCYIIYLLSTTI